MDKPTPAEIEQAVRRGCRGLPEAVVRLNLLEAMADYTALVTTIMWAELERMVLDGSKNYLQIMSGENELPVPKA